MKHSLQTFVSLLSFGLILSACTGQKTSVYAPVIPPPTYKTDPALLDQIGAAPKENASATQQQEEETPDQDAKEAITE